jgi:hypothetical protein
MTEDSNKARLNLMQVDSTDPENVRPVVLSPAERDELVSCLEKGAEARRANVDHGANPYLTAPVIPHGPATREDRLNILRVDAWWDGWEEVPRDPEQVGLPLE